MKQVDRRVSVIIRTLNEERWITQTLRSITRQRTARFVEIVLVDNESKDSTVARARSIVRNLKLVNEDDYRPGKALNRGIRASSGDTIIVLSAHCPPATEDWLENLVEPLGRPDIGAVYGRQLPTKSSSEIATRELVNSFGIEPFLKEKDPFFHNANSAFRREVWEAIPFDEEVTNLEDRIWAQGVLAEGWKIAYEPEAQVYHEDGFHTESDPSRVRGALTVIEKTLGQTAVSADLFYENHDFSSVGVVPIPGTEKDLAKHEKAIKNLIKEFNQIDGRLEIYGLASTKSGVKFGKRMGLDTAFQRPQSLTHGRRTADLYRWFMAQLDSAEIFPDAVLVCELTASFRPRGLLAEMVRTFESSPFESLIPGFLEKRPAWNLEHSEAHQIISLDMPKRLRRGIAVGLPALCTVSRPDVLRRGMRIGSTVGLLKVESHLARLEEIDSVAVPEFLDYQAYD